MVLILNNWAQNVTKFVTLYKKNREKKMKKKKKKFKKKKNQQKSIAVHPFRIMIILRFYIYSL